jgi:hypothetical protein
MNFVGLIVVSVVALSGQAVGNSQSDQFGVQCGALRASIDLNKREWCRLLEGKCPVQAVREVTPAEIVLRDDFDDQARMRIVWKLNRAEGTFVMPGSIVKPMPCTKVDFIPPDRPKF